MQTLILGGLALGLVGLTGYGLGWRRKGHLPHRCIDCDELLVAPDLCSTCEAVFITDLRAARSEMTP